MVSETDDSHVIMALQATLRPTAAIPLVVGAVIRSTNTTGCLNDYKGDREDEPQECSFAVWSYGNAIVLDAILYAAKFIPSDHTAEQVSFVNARLASWLASPHSAAWNLTHNVTMPWPQAVGDTIGLYPFAYLSAAAHSSSAGAASSNATDLQIASTTAGQYILGWPVHGVDGIITRLDQVAGECWKAGPKQPPGHHDGSCVWADDSTMGLTLLARMASLGVPASGSSGDVNTMRRVLSAQHALFVKHLRDVAGDGLYWHGADASLQEHSCCKWGRANGWLMTAHVEVLHALEKSSAEFAAVLAVFQSHAQAVAAAQSLDGRWHQVLTNSSSWLETSSTAMFAHTIAVGVLEGWLPRAEFESVLAKAWDGLAKVIASDGTFSANK